jgi:hypothetical protein
MSKLQFSKTPLNKAPPSPRSDSNGITTVLTRNGGNTDKIRGIKGSVR